MPRKDRMGVSSEPYWLAPVWSLSILTSLHGFAHFLLWITACLAAPQLVAYLRIEVLKERRNRGGTYPLAQDSKVKTPSLLLVGLGGTTYHSIHKDNSELEGYRRGNPLTNPLAKKYQFIPYRYSKVRKKNRFQHTFWRFFHKKRYDFPSYSEDWKVLAVAQRKWGRERSDWQEEKSSWKRKDVVITRKDIADWGKAGRKGASVHVQKLAHLRIRNSSSVEALWLSSGPLISRQERVKPLKKTKQDWF